MVFEKVFQDDLISKRERVERTLNFQPVDRIALHEQLSYHPGVISAYCGRKIQGFQYNTKDIGMAVRACLDATFPLFAPYGRGTQVKADGFEYYLDDWTKWIKKRPFEDEKGAKKWLKDIISDVENKLKNFDAKKERRDYHNYFMDQQALIGETVLIDWSIMTRFCEIYDKMGLEIFTYFYWDYPDVMKDFMEKSTEYAVRKVESVADSSLSPVALLAEDFCSKSGPTFSPEILNKVHYPYVEALTNAWHSKDIKMIYHTDGNFKSVIEDLLRCGVDGFYCLERSCSMKIEELKREYPNLIWAGGLDGVDTLEFSTPQAVEEAVKFIIEETNALHDGGIFMDSSSEINPSIPAENFFAMLRASNTMWNKELC